MEGVTDRPHACAAVQRNFSRLEKWAEESIMKFNNGKHKSLCLWRSNPKSDELESSSTDKNLGVLVDS